MKCKNCGAELKEDARFCTECGSSQSIPQDSQSPQRQSSDPAVSFVSQPKKNLSYVVILCVIVAIIEYQLACVWLDHMIPILGFRGLINIGIEGVEWIIFGSVVVAGSSKALEILSAIVSKEPIDSITVIGKEYHERLFFIFHYGGKIISIIGMLGFAIVILEFYSNTDTISWIALLGTTPHCKRIFLGELLDQFSQIFSAMESQKAETTDK